MSHRSPVEVRRDFGTSGTLLKGYEVPQGSRPIGWVGSDPTGTIEIAYFDPLSLQAAVVTIARETGDPFENPRMIARLTRRRPAANRLLSPFPASPVPTLVGESS